MTMHDDQIWVNGDVKCSDQLSTDEAMEIIEEIQDMMIFYKLIKIDLCIDPYKFPKEILDIKNL
jgi:hypothetical protein